MPLNNNMDHNEKVRELIDSYKKNGKIGNTKPKSLKAAISIANAIAYSMEKE